MNNYEINPAEIDNLVEQLICCDCQLHGNCKEIVTPYCGPYVKLWEQIVWSKIEVKKRYYRKDYKEKSEE